MYSALIGELLDEAIDIENWHKAELTQQRLEWLGVAPEQGQPVDPRTLRRALLAEWVKGRWDAAGGRPLSLPDRCTYRDLLLRCRKPGFPEISLPALNHEPDIVFAWPPDSIVVTEAGYGFNEREAMAAIDRLLHAVWFSNGHVADTTVDFVAYVFLLEIEFGDIIAKVERRYADWIDAHYGPFNGLPRIGVPMMPRLTRSSKIGRNGLSSAMSPPARLTGFAAFCISYERDAP